MLDSGMLSSILIKLSIPHLGIVDKQIKICPSSTVE